MPTVALRDCELYYEETGSGEVIILMPGLGHDHAYYDKTVPLLAPVGRVVAIDPRGLGRSVCSSPDYSVEQWADDVVRLIGHLGGGPAHLVGSSLGACIALQAALDAPGKVASLALVAGFSELDRSLEINFRMRMKIIERLGLSDVLADHIAMWTLGRSFLDTEAGRAAADRLVTSVRRNSPEKYLAFIQAILRFGRVEPDQLGQQKMTERLASIRVPTCIITGGEDILTPLPHAERMRDRIAGSELHVIPGCGHITFSERPDETVALIKTFLSRVVGR